MPPLACPAPPHCHTARRPSLPAPAHSTYTSLRLSLSPTVAVIRTFCASQALEKVEAVAITRQEVHVVLQAYPKLKLALETAARRHVEMYSLPVRLPPTEADLKLEGECVRCVAVARMLTAAVRGLTSPRTQCIRDSRASTPRGATQCRQGRIVAQVRAEGEPDSGAAV